jgi:hypothetical protein
MSSTNHLDLSYGKKEQKKDSHTTGETQFFPEEVLHNQTTDTTFKNSPQIPDGVICELLKIGEYVRLVWLIYIDFLSVFLTPLVELVGLFCVGCEVVVGLLPMF